MSIAADTSRSPLAVDATSGRSRVTRLAMLFPDSPARPITRAAATVAVLAAAAAVVVSLLRGTGTGPLQSIWEEDSRNIMTDALYLSGPKAILTPVNGYYVVVARLVGEVADFLPVRWAAAVLSLSSAILLALLVILVYVASGAHLGSRLARFMMAAPLLVAPVAENNRSEIYNRPVCLHLFALYALFWVILWVPKRRWASVAAIVTAGLTAGSTILTVAFIPLALIRVGVRRDRTGISILAVLVAGTVANGLVVRGGGTGRGVMYPEPLLALVDYVVWALPSSMLGYRATSGLGAFHFLNGGPVDAWAVVGDHAGVVALAWLIVGAVVAVAASRRFTRAAWPLAALAGAHSVGLLCMMVMAQGNEQRYLLPVELLLFAALTALLQPAGQKRSRDRPRLSASAPLVAFALFVAVVGAFNYRWHNTFRAHAPHWGKQIAQAAQECQRRPDLDEVMVRSAPEPFGSVVHVPCHRLRAQRPWDCPEPRCVRINGSAIHPRMTRTTYSDL